MKRPLAIALFALIPAVLPPARSADTFVPAPEPRALAPSPVRGADEQNRFSLPPGFQIELVASEAEGAGKAVTVAWDDSGRLWTMTALEYPLDGNENPDAARALYQKGGRDRVLIFENPYGPAPTQPKVFAEGLAMPMGLLPYKDGALVGMGPSVFWMHDTDGDDRADQKEILLTGFGVQDSHLLPHQFTRAPGGWFYLAQGAFNYSKVITRDGQEHRFDQTRLARFTPDGLKFQDLTSGPCNIWGLVIGREGETFIQEANDYGYPVMAYQEGASYPGCSGAYKPYSPWFPSEVGFRMGGTGLSGLALSDPRGSFPGAYADVMYVANPITRKIQAIKIHPHDGWYRYELLGDFVLSSDEWFRPVSIHFGPDGCLYIVDWYNKIISHNEVPRNHPERDKTRGRIWRVRHQSQPRGPVPNLARADGRALLQYLQSDSTWQMRGAWHQIVDRNLTGLAAELKTIAENPEASAPARIHAFWSLEDLHALPPSTIELFASSPNRNLRREAIRSTRGLASASFAFSLAEKLLRDADPKVRSEALRVALQLAPRDPRAMTLIAASIQPSLAAPVGKNPQNGQPMKLGEAYDRDFERYLVRSALETMPGVTTRFLASGEGKSASPESQALMLLALPKAEGTAELARVLPRLDRIPNEEELLRLAENLREPAALDAIHSLLEKSDARKPVIEALMKVRLRIDAQKIAPILAAPLGTIWREEMPNREFVANAAAAFKIRDLAPQLESGLTDAKPALQIAMLRALRELGAGDLAKIAALARSSKDRAVKAEALNSIAASNNASKEILEFWPDMNAIQRRASLAQLTRRKEDAAALFAAVQSGAVREGELDAQTVERIRELLPENPEARQFVERLSTKFQPVLRLDGDTESYVDSNITLDGPFTVETWVKLDPGISNEDGILGAPGRADLNFASGLFRVYCGPEFGDRAITRRPIAPNSWTHLAVTRDSAGVFRAYINGELDSTDLRPVTAPLKDLDIGRTTPNRGTAGELTEFRIWNLARTAEEIRADFDHTWAGEPLPSGLTHYYPGAGPWRPLHGNAKVEKVTDAPALLTTAQAAEQAAKFARFRSLAQENGDQEKGKATFAATCAICHSVGGQGGQIGPVLNGAAANGLESLLRSVLTPNAAMEAGYRTFRVEMKDGDVVDGFLVSQNDEAIILRQPNSEDRRIAKSEVRQADFVRMSLMPEGLLDRMPDQDVRDLFAYLKTLK